MKGLTTVGGFVNRHTHSIGGVHVEKTPTLQYGALNGRAKGDIPFSYKSGSGWFQREAKREVKIPPGSDNQPDGVNGRERNCLLEFKVLWKGTMGLSRIKNHDLQPIRGSGDDSKVKCAATGPS
jgi:hypothetical protein